MESDYDKDSSYDLVDRANKKNALETVMFKMEKFRTE